MIFAFIVLLLQCNYITNVGNNLKWWEGIFTWIGSFWMVASQHPMRIGLTQSHGWLLRNILFRSCLTQSPLKTSAALMFLLFHARQFPRALASLVSYQPLSVFNSKLLTQPMIHSFYFVELLSRLRTKKPTLFAWAL